MFVGLTDYWAASACLWHKMFGGAVFGGDLIHVRSKRARAEAAEASRVFALRELAPHLRREAPRDAAAVPATAAPPQRNAAPALRLRDAARDGATYAAARALFVARLDEYWDACPAAVDARSASADTCERAKLPPEFLARRGARS